MAWSVISKPGTELGPCVDECAHIDCAQLKEMVETICHLCNKPIGYETQMCFDGVLNTTRRLVHYWCMVEAVEVANAELVGKSKKSNG